MISINFAKGSMLITVLGLYEATWAAMTAMGERTMNQAEADGWSEKVRRRAERIFGFVLLILLAAILLISASLFVAPRTPSRALPSADTQGSDDFEKERAPAPLTPV